MLMMVKRPPSTKKFKIETVDEFLARGGQVKKLEPVSREDHRIVLPTAGGPPTIMSLGEAEVLYGEAERPQESPEKRRSKVNVHLIPPELRARLGLNAESSEGSEDEAEEAGEEELD